MMAVIQKHSPLELINANKKDASHDDTRTVWAWLIETAATTSRSHTSFKGGGPNLTPAHQLMPLPLTAAAIFKSQLQFSLVRSSFRFVELKTDFKTVWTHRDGRCGGGLW